MALDRNQSPTAGRQATFLGKTGPWGGRLSMQMERATTVVIGRVRSSVGSLRFHANRGCFALGHGGFDRKRIVDILRGIAFHAVLPPPGASRSQSASTNRRGWKRLERVPAPLRKSSAGAQRPLLKLESPGAEVTLADCASPLQIRLIQ